MSILPDLPLATEEQQHPNFRSNWTGWVKKGESNFLVKSFDFNSSLKWYITSLKDRVMIEIQE